MYEKVSIESTISKEHVGRVFKLISEVKSFEDAKVSLIEVLPGGLTNSNYKVIIDDVTYAVRLAGAGTMEYLDRPAEKHNAQVMADMGISADIIYYDDTTGNQICKYLDDSITLHIKDFKEDKYLSMAAHLFKKYHDSGKEFTSVFNPLKEIDTYIALLAAKNFEFYEGAEIMEQKLEEIKELFKLNPPKFSPCHNDPLCENWLDDKKNFYLIDWEYGGMNDPLFDLGALAIEAELTEEQECYFLKEYFGGELTEKQVGSLVINKFLCDALWAYWAVLQIAMGKSREEYWPYGLNRFNRACALIHDGSLGRGIEANK